MTSKTKRVKKQPIKSRVWRTFLKINSPLKGDHPPECDSAYLVSKGIEPESPIVFGLIRDEVIPQIVGIKAAYSIGKHAVPLTHYWFLVHDRESGVPTTEDDKACYLDVTFVFADEVPFQLDEPFVMTTPGALENIERPSGWDHSALDERGTMFLLYRQALLVCDFIRAHKDDVSTFTLMKHYRQYIHYIANIGQMKLS